MSGISINVLVPAEPIHDIKLRPYLDQQTRQLFPHAGDAVAYTCRLQHPNSTTESAAAHGGEHDPEVLPRVLLLGHPKVPIGLASALARLPLGVKAAVTMPAQLMQLSSGADGRVDENPEDPEHMGEPLCGHKQHHRHHGHSDRDTGAAGAGSSHHTGTHYNTSSSWDGVQKQQQGRPGDLRQPSGVYAATLAAGRLQLKPAADDGSSGPIGSSRRSKRAHLLLPKSANAHQQLLDRSTGSASSASSSSSYHADGTHKSWKEGAPAPKWAASRPVAVPPGGRRTGRHAARPAAAKSSAQVAAAGRVAAEEPEGSLAGSEDSSFVTAAGGSVRSFTTALSSSSDGASAVGSPGAVPAVRGAVEEQITGSSSVVTAYQGGAFNHRDGSGSSSSSHAPAEVPVILTMTTSVDSNTAPVSKAEVPGQPAAAAPAGEADTHVDTLPAGAVPEGSGQPQELQQHGPGAHKAHRAADSSSTEEDQGTVTYEMEVLGIIPGTGLMVGRPILSGRAQDLGLQLSYKHLPHDGLSPTKRRPCRDWCLRHFSLNFLAPLRAAKGGLRWLGLRKSNRSRKDTEQHGDVAA